MNHILYCGISKHFSRHFKLRLRKRNNETVNELIVLKAKRYYNREYTIVT